MQLSLFGLLLLTQPLNSSKQDTRANLEFSSNFGLDIVSQSWLNIGDSYCRPVVPGCAGCAMAHPDFGRSVNPISTRGTDNAHLITTGTPGFSNLPTAL